MNARELAKSAYKTATVPVRNERVSEHEVIAGVTHRLKRAAENGALGFPDLAAAVHDNRKLWTTLAAAVSSPENDLPEDLRARLFYLAEVSIRHGTEVMAGRAAPDLLVEINSAVMTGLRYRSPSP